MNTKLDGKSNTNHTHNYAGSASAGGSATSAVKLDSNAGSATQPVYFNGGKPVACTYSLGKSVPANAVFTDTNTWRGIQNSLTSTSTTDSLAAAQGKALNDKFEKVVRVVGSGGTSHMTLEYDAQGLKFSIGTDDDKYAIYFRLNRSDGHVIMNTVLNAQWKSEKQIY